MIKLVFPTPIYEQKISNLNQIQQDFDSVFTKLKSTNKFQQHPNWNYNTHKLSDISFNENLLIDYEVNSFVEELTIHINNFMRQAGTHPSKFNSFKIIQSWMTLTTKNEFANVHTHGGSDISGVYYFKTSGNDGNIFFRSPNKLLANSHCFPDTSEIETRPEVSKLLLFPSWLEHGTRPNTTESERVSISFNIIFQRDI